MLSPLPESKIGDEASETKACLCFLLQLHNSSEQEKTVERTRTMFRI